MNTTTSDKESHFKVTMEWNEATKQWRMSFADGGDFLQEFYPCKNLKDSFKGLNEHYPQTYEIRIRQL